MRVVSLARWGSLVVLLGCSRGEVKHATNDDAVGAETTDALIKRADSLYALAPVPEPGSPSIVAMWRWGEAISAWVMSFRQAALTPTASGASKSTGISPGDEGLSLPAKLEGN